MINPDELRLGNLFILPNGNIGKITYHEIRLLIVGNPKPDYKPIELTEEWLRKAGFKKMPGNTFQNINLPYWCKKSVLLFFNTGQEEYSFKIGYGEIVEGKYFAATFRWINKLHILQNIFYDLTSKKLTIKL